MRLHSGDSLGTGAACAASVACAEEALLRREAASEAKRPKGPQGAALMRTECHAAFRAPLWALRFARALDCSAICAGSLRNAARFCGAFGVPQKRIHPSARRFNLSASGHAEPGTEAACLFEGTPGVSHAKRCADKSAANEGWGPKTGNRAATGSEPVRVPACLLHSEGGSDTISKRIF